MAGNGFTLSANERETIRRFVGAISNVGARSILMLRVTQKFGGGDVPAAALDAALEELREVCRYKDGVVDAPERVYLAAPSLALVTTCVEEIPATSPLRFPGNFIPSLELMEKCNRHYFTEVDDRAAGILNEI